MYLTGGVAEADGVDAAANPAKMRPRLRPGDLDVSRCSGADAETKLRAAGLLGDMATS